MGGGHRDRRFVSVGMLMRVFDFDGTLYDGDSTVDFFQFAVRHVPAVWGALPGQLVAAVLYATKHLDLEEFKERFYAFFARIPNMDALLVRFWETHRRKLKPEVVSCVQQGDVIASASPAFLLAIPAAELGVHLIASEVDQATGHLLGPNCRDKAKRQRLIEAGFARDIEEFYSDSRADAPCVALARRGVLVTGRRLSAYPSAWVADCNDGAAPDRANAASR